MSNQKNKHHSSTLCQLDQLPLLYPSFLKNLILEGTFCANGLYSQIFFFFLMKPPPPRSTLFPYPTLFQSAHRRDPPAGGLHLGVERRGCRGRQEACGRPQVRPEP